MPGAGERKASAVTLTSHNQKCGGHRRGRGSFQRKGDELVKGLVELEERVEINLGLSDTWLWVSGERPLLGIVSDLHQGDKLMRERKQNDLGGFDIETQNT